MNKKGAEMTIGTIVWIILALVVLVVIIYGFTTGWGNLWENIIGFGGGKVNVQTVVQSCQLDCNTASKFGWCTKERKVVFKEGEDAVVLTCDTLQSEYPEAGLEGCDITCTETSPAENGDDTPADDSGGEVPDTGQE